MDCRAQLGSSNLPIRANQSRAANWNSSPQAIGSPDSRYAPASMAAEVNVMVKRRGIDQVMCG